MTRILTNSDDTIATERDGLGRRALLKGAAAAVAATGFTANASLGSLRHAIGPDGRSNEIDGAAAVGTAARQPLPGLPFGIGQEGATIVWALRFSCLRGHDGC
ncbi:hypothetical protein ACVWZZ_007159 [Bradyrhizobium sp. LM6.10]